MNTPDRMVVAPSTSNMEMVLVSAGHAMDCMTDRMERNDKKGRDVGRGFTMLALTDVEGEALADLLQKTKLPKELYELRKQFKRKNFVTIQKGGRG